MKIFKYGKRPNLSLNTADFGIWTTIRPPHLLLALRKRGTHNVGGGVLDELVLEEGKPLSKTIGA